MFRAVIREDLIAENSPLNHIAIRRTFSGVLRFAYYDSCLPKRCRTNETWFGLSSVITPSVFNPFKLNSGFFCSDWNLVIALGFGPKQPYRDPLKEVVSL